MDKPKAESESKGKSYFLRSLLGALKFLSITLPIVIGIIAVTYYIVKYVEIEPKNEKIRTLGDTLKAKDEIIKQQGDILRQKNEVIESKDKTLSKYEGLERDYKESAAMKNQKHKSLEDKLKDFEAKYNDQKDKYEKIGQEKKSFQEKMNQYSKRMDGLNSALNDCQKEKFELKKIVDSIPLIERKVIKGGNAESVLNGELTVKPFVDDAGKSLKRCSSGIPFRIEFTDKYRLDLCLDKGSGESFKYRGNKYLIKYLSYEYRTYHEHFYEIEIIRQQ